MIEPKNLTTHYAAKSSYGGLLLDGVTGTGKSTILAILSEILGASPGWRRTGIFPEEQTYGDFWDELQANPESPDEYKTRLLAKVVTEVEQARAVDSDYHFILERAQYSLYAALPDWRLYASFDERLSRFNPIAILLDISDEALKERSVNRNDRPWARDQLIQLHGNESSAIKSLRGTQDRRKEALEFSKIPYRIIDTTSGKWDVHAAEIKAILMGT